MSRRLGFYSISIRVAAVIEINREIGHAVVGPRRTFEARGGAMTKAVHRHYILADRASVALELVDFDLEWAGIVASIANFAIDQHLGAAAHQASVGHLDRLRTDQRIKHVAGEAQRAEQYDDCALTHFGP